MNQRNRKTAKEVAIIEIHGNGDVSFCGTWQTIDGTTQDLDEATRFNELAESIGFAVALAAHNCDDVRILPVDVARKTYEDAGGPKKP